MKTAPQQSDSPGAAPAAKEASVGDMLMPLVVAAVVMFAFLTFPPSVAELNADASLNAVLHHASGHGFQFGTELVSTYGPLGFLVFPQYSSHALGLRMATDMLVCLTVSVGLCLVAWRLRFPWGLLLIGVFLWTTSNLWLRMDLVLQSGLFCWGLLCLVEQERRLEACAIVYSLLAAFCGLAKISFLFIGAGGLALLALHLVVGGRGRFAVATVAVFCAAFLSGWLAAGQDLGNLGAFLERALLVARSYGAALGVEGLRSVRPAGFIAAVLVLAVVLLRSWAIGRPEQKHLPWYRLLFFAWVLLFTFTAWKHGFVRGDNWHVGFFLGFVPLLLLALETVPVLNDRLRFWGRVLSIPPGVLTLVALQLYSFPPLPGSLFEPFALFRSNLQRVFKPGEYDRAAGKFLSANQHACELPRFRQLVGTASVDVFGQHQAYALFNGLNYRPRPVFQSYNACNARLMSLNEEFFFSASAPEYWLFHLSPMDRKFAPLEDAWLLRDLLINCQLVGAENDSLLLRKAASQRPRLRLLQEGEVAPGQPLDLRGWNSEPLWLVLQVKPSFAGELRQIFYRPPIIRLAAWREQGRGLIHRHQAPAPMMEAGFLASPLLVNTADVEELFSGKEIVRPGAYTVELGGSGAYWSETVQFRVYRLENNLATEHK